MVTIDFLGFQEVNFLEEKIPGRKQFLEVKKGPFWGQSFLIMKFGGEDSSRMDFPGGGIFLMETF